jgi:tetratricopeptide (TPR) repeat protein
MWMTAVSLTAAWLWRSRALVRLWGIPFGAFYLPILLVTTVLCRSIGALVLLLGGLFVLWTSSWFKTRLVLLALLLVGPVYVGSRLNNLWSGERLVALAKSVFGEERGESLHTRFTAEDLIGAKAMQQPIFGWGGFDRAAVYYNNDDSVPEHRVPTDGLWLIMASSRGLVGLGLLYTAMTMPAFLFLRRFPARLWRDPKVGACAVAAVLLGIYMIDCLLNAFINVIYVTLAGGLVSVMPQLRGAGARGGSQGADAHGGTVGAGAGALELADRCYRLGRRSKDQGRLSEARTAWSRALEILGRLVARAPESPQVQRRWCDCANDLAWLLLNHPDPASRNPGAALALCGQAVQRCPGSAVYWNTLGVAHFRAGDFKSAVIALERAMDLTGEGTPFDHVFLAMVHARLGHTEEAQQWLDHALFRLQDDYRDHPELGRFCEEARSMIAMGPEAPATAH